MMCCKTFHCEMLIAERRRYCSDEKAIHFSGIDKMQGMTEGLSVCIVPDCTSPFKCVVSGASLCCKNGDSERPFINQQKADFWLPINQPTCLSYRHPPTSISDLVGESAYFPTTCAGKRERFNSEQVGID